MDWILRKGEVLSKGRTSQLGNISISVSGGQKKRRSLAQSSALDGFLTRITRGRSPLEYSIELKKGPLDPFNPPTETDPL